MKLIVIRADGNKNIGMGHLTRQIDIAKEFLKMKFEVIFMIKSFDEAISILEVNNVNMLKLNKQEENIKSTKKGLDNIVKTYKKKPDIIIVDLLEDFDNQIYLDLVNEYCQTLVILSDEVKPFYINADIVFAISQNQESVNYSNVKGTKYYTGLEYFPLKKEYENVNQKQIKSEVSKILLTFGGSDPQEFSERVIEIFKELNLDKEITLIIGPAVSEKRYHKITKIIPNNFFLKRNERNMIKHFIETDMCICSAGNTLVELLTYGVPCIVLPQTEREECHAKTFDAKNMAISLKSNFKNVELIKSNLFQI